MKKLFLLCTAALLFSGLSFGQTDKGKAKDTTMTSATSGKTPATISATAKKPMPRSCPGKTCGKKKD